MNKTTNTCLNAFLIALTIPFASTASAASVASISGLKLMVPTTLKGGPWMACAQDSLNDFNRGQGTQTDRNYVFDQGVKAALRSKYTRSGSSTAAERQVAAVLDRHGCDGSIVGSIGFNEWGGSSIGIDNNLATTVGSYGQDEATKMNYDLLVSASHPGQVFSETEAANLNSRWETLGQGGQCGNIRRRLHSVCTGEINSSDEFDKLMDGTHLLATGEGATGIIDYILRYHDRVISEKKADIDKANIQLQRTNDAIDRRIESINEEMSHPGPVARHEGSSAQPGLEGVSPSDNDLMSEKIRLQQEKKENNEAIKTNNELKPDLDSSNPGTPIKDPKNPIENVNRELAYEHFLENVWEPQLRSLEAKAKTCSGDLSSPWVELLQPDESAPLRGGESCDYDAALRDLNKINNPVVDPRLPNEAATTVPDRVHKAMQNMPACDHADPTIDCEAVTDRYLRGIGFDGGTGEFCKVTTVGASVCTMHEANLTVDRYSGSANSGLRWDITATGFVTSQASPTKGNDTGTNGIAESNAILNCASKPSLTECRN